MTASLRNPGGAMPAVNGVSFDLWATQQGGWGARDAFSRLLCQSISPTAGLVLTPPHLSRTVGHRLRRFGPQTHHELVGRRMATPDLGSAQIGP